MLNLYMALGAVGTRYNPLINYTWSTSTIASDYVTNGVELVTNGGFDTPDGWVLGLGISISDGEVIFTGNANANINRNITLEVGALYRTTVVITEYTSGFVNINVDGFNRGADISGVGTHTLYTLYTTATTGATTFLQEDSVVGFVGKITSYSVQKVIQEPNKRYLRDSGTSKSHMALYSGSGVKTNSVDQSIIVGVL